MKRLSQIMILTTCLITASTTLAESSAVTTLLSEYTQQGADKPDAAAGRQLWLQTFQGDTRYPQRSCTSCHTADPKQAGKHVRTRKRIEPMAPSANPQRLTERREIIKWFKRNCKWTLGRECTAREKADLLTFLQQQ